MKRSNWLLTVVPEEAAYILAHTEYINSEQFVEDCLLMESGMTAEDITVLRSCCQKPDEISGRDRFMYAVTPAKQALWQIEHFMNCPVKRLEYRYGQIAPQLKAEITSAIENNADEKDVVDLVKRAMAFCPPEVQKIYENVTGASQPACDVDEPKVEAF